MSHQDPPAEVGVLAALKRLSRFIIPDKFGTEAALAPSAIEQLTSSSGPSIAPLNHDSSYVQFLISVKSDADTNP